MAVDIFLKLSNNIKGESQDETHRNEIDVLAWNWGLTQSGTTHVGSGGGGGKVNVQDITLTKYVDLATNDLNNWMQSIRERLPDSGAVIAGSGAGGGASNSVRVTLIWREARPTAGADANCTAVGVNDAAYRCLVGEVFP